MHLLWKWMSLGLLLLAGLIIIQCACKTVDYMYRHDVSGVVVDENNNPVVGALVYRPEGVDYIYERITDDQGQFSFEYSGLGREPEEFLEWTLMIEHEGYQNQELIIQIPWVNYEEGREDYGYVKQDIQIQVAPLED